MKLNRNLSIILVILFILATSYTAVEVISLPSDILLSVDITENAKVQRAEKEAIPVYISLGVDLLLVLLIIFTLSTSAISSRGENIVYVEREVTRKEAEGTAEEDTATILQQNIEKTRNVIGAIPRETPHAFTEKAFAEICNQLDAAIGAIYKADHTQTPKQLQFIVGYAFFLPESETLTYEFGEGLVGQVAKSQKTTIFSNIPEEYVQVASGLGSASPKNLIALPLLQDGNLVGVMEIASFRAFTQIDVDYLEAVSELILEALVQTTISK